MAEENTPAKPPAGGADPINSPQPQAGNPEPQAGDGSTEPISLEAAQKLRSEALNLRKRLKDAETLAAELKAFKEQSEASQLSETEKRDRATQQREKQLADLQASLNARDLQLQEERNYNALERAGRRAGIHDETALADAIRLVDTSALEHDENGKPTNADDLMKQLVKTRSWLTGNAQQRPQTAGGATAPARSQVAAGEINDAYVAEVMNGKIPWQTLTPDQKTAVLNWQVKNPYRF